ncbi:Uncharacterized protein BM_BM14313 [Brugia malayi]|uniref:Bm14313 n=1 Tax=Brugia malayi TaxID=6279 RepID=A0A0K0J0T8_BRUMA|nr:Uncharacterized protein BM_BM14313 [Brugia malayi]CDQ01286.1 Bm14313 [Brugia malayi]VIO95440.1 Uncharacterized protein BM_BM14313 [Brugia malayi]
MSEPFIQELEERSYVELLRCFVSLQAHPVHRFHLYLEHLNVGVYYFFYGYQKDSFKEGKGGNRLRSIKEFDVKL